MFAFAESKTEPESLETGSQTKPGRDRELCQEGKSQNPLVSHQGPTIRKQEGARLGGGEPRVTPDH